MKFVIKICFFCKYYFKIWEKNIFPDNNSTLKETFSVILSYIGFSFWKYFLINNSFQMLWWHRKLGFVYINLTFSIAVPQFAVLLHILRTWRCFRGHNLSSLCFLNFTDHCTFDTSKTPVVLFYYGKKKNTKDIRFSWDF